MAKLCARARQQMVHRKKISTTTTAKQTLLSGEGRNTHMSAEALVNAHFRISNTFSKYHQNWVATETHTCHHRQRHTRKNNYKTNDHEAIETIRHQRNNARKKYIFEHSHFFSSPTFPSLPFFKHWICCIIKTQSILLQ